AWRVAPGDEIELNQTVCEIETAKSVVELPSPYTGVVKELLAEEGQTVPVGESIMRVQTDDAPASGPGVEPSEDEEDGAVLVGYGVSGNVQSRRRRGGEPLLAGTPLDDAVIPVAAASPVIAKPPIRKLAKDLDVDLTK